MTKKLVIPAALLVLTATGAVAQDVIQVRKPVQYRTPPQLGPLLIEVRGFIRVAPLRVPPYSLTGEGQTVAVLDTGVRATHVDFGRGARVVEQRNFTSDNGGKVDDAADGNGHGTNVAGIIAAGGINEGIANRAKVVAVKVLANGGGGTQQGTEQALKWVVDNRARLGITAVNMSLSWQNNTADDSAYAADEIAKSIRALRASGVPVVVSAGNHYHTYKAQGMAYPAILRETVSVGAVYDADGGSVAYQSGARANKRAPGQITPFSQRLHSSAAAQTYTDILAPGAPVTSTGIDNDDTAVSTQDGTSQAAPVVAGVILLMQEYLRKNGQAPATVDDLERWLRAGARDEKDGDNEDDNVPHTQLVFKRVDALGAVEAMARERGLPTAGRSAPSPPVPLAGPGTAAAACSAGDPSALNLDWSATDVNGFPRNPWWNVQGSSSQAVDPADPCVCGGFPLKATGAPVTNVAYGQPPCTNQTMLDVPRGGHALTCKLEWIFDRRSNVTRGHINWFPVVLSGHAFFDHQSGPDNDVNFELVPDSRAPTGGIPAQTKWNAGAGDLKRADSLHVEMKKKETLDYLTHSWWRTFAEADQGDARGQVNGLRAVAVGLFGLDAEHKGHSELHPAYALAFRTRCDQAGDRTTETWSVFARNYGNEGWCSRWDEWHQLALGNKALVLQLPLDSPARSITLGATSLFSDRATDAMAGLVSTAGTSADLQLAWPGAGDSQEVRVHGQVSFTWRAAGPGPRCVPPPPAPPVVAGELRAPEEGVERLLEDLTDKAASLRPQAQRQAESPDDKRVPVQAMPLAPMVRTGACPKGAATCGANLRARTGDVFFATPSAAAAAEARFVAQVDDELCNAAPALLPDYTRAAAGKAVDSPEGLRLRSLESLISMCDVASEPGAAQP